MNSIIHSLWLRHGVFATTLFFTVNATAETEMTLRSALNKTLQNNNELKAYHFNLLAEEGMHVQAGILPSPKMGLEVDNLLGTKSHDGIQKSEVTLSFSQTVEMMSKRQNRLAVSKSRHDKLLLERELSKVDVLAETTRRYYQLLKLQAISGSIHRQIENNKQALQKVQRLVSIGTADPLDISTLNLQLKQNKALLKANLNRYRTAQHQLANMWQSAERIHPKGNLLVLPKVPNETSIQQIVDESPAILHQLSLLREADSNLQLVQSQSRSNITYQFGLTHRQIDNSQSVNLGVSMPLNFKNPNRGRIAAAQARLKANKWQLEAASQDLKLRLKEHLLNMQTHIDQANDIQHSLLPEVKKLTSLTLKSYQRGSASILQYTAAQQQLFDLEIQYINASAQAYNSLLELERLTGSSLAQQGDK